MAHNRGILGPNDQGAEMVESEAVQALFTWRRLGCVPPPSTAILNPIDLD